MDSALPRPALPRNFWPPTALNRYVRNPTCIVLFAVFLAGEAATLHSLRLLGYAAFLCVPLQLFVVYYEEPTLRRQFGDSCEPLHPAVNSRL